MNENYTMAVEREPAGAKPRRTQTVGATTPCQPSFLHPSTHCKRRSNPSAMQRHSATRVGEDSDSTSSATQPARQRSDATKVVKEGG